jgi:hypothetical protein
MPTPYTGKVYQEPPRRPYTGKVYGEPPEAENTMARDIKRGLGLTGRFLAEAPTAIPLMVGDAANTAINMATGSKLRLPSEVVRSGLNEVFPEPTGPLERISQVASSALGGSAVATLAARVASRAGPTAAKFAQFLADRPAMQTAGALAGATAVEGARDAGVQNPYALMGIGMLGSTATGGGAQVAGRVAAAGKAASQPFVRSGQELIAGRQLNRMATDPQAAIQNMESPQAGEIITGSRPTVSQVSRDPGMISNETAFIRGIDTKAELAGRASEQNAARMGVLNRMAGDEGKLDAIKKKQQATYGQLAEPAFANATPIPIGREWINNPILRTIQQIRDSKAGARETVRDALDEAEALLTHERVNITDAESLYNVRKDIDLIRSGQLKGRGLKSQERANLKSAERELGEVIKAIDDTIESGAPGYKAYKDMYRKRSIPVDQVTALQKVRKDTVLTTTDQIAREGGEAVLSNAKFQTLLKNNLKSGINLMGKEVGDGRLSPKQLENLNAIAKDLDRGAAASSSIVKVPGSDSFRNLSVANIFGAMIGDDMANLAQQSAAFKTATKPLELIYRIPEAELQRIMVQAWLDPKMAAALMRRASSESIEDFGKSLRETVSANIMAQSLYGSEGAR